MAKVPYPQSPSPLKTIVLLILISKTYSGLNSVAPLNYSINSVTNYTWSINFNNAGTYHPLLLTFPSQIAFSSTTIATVSGTPQIITVLNATNQINITSPLTSPVTIVVTNVRNPPSAINTVAFSYNNNIDGTVNLLNTFANRVTYLTGPLASCPWTFSLCTEQPNSNLLISFTTINPIASGNHFFLIGFFGTWANHFSKGLVPSAVTTLPCAYRLNSSSFITGTCNVNGLTLEFPFASTGVPAGTSVTVRVEGVNAPPTTQTASTADYFIFTADSNRARIDGLTNCLINNVCVSNQTSGNLVNTSLIINRNYGSPEVRFPIVPFIVTLQRYDTIDVSYSNFTALTTCQKLTVYRDSSSTSFTLASPTPGTGFITFAFPLLFGFNTEYSDPVSAFLECTGFMMPPSMTPVTLSFTFKRNGDTYMLLSTPISASATAFNASRARIVLSNPAMVASSTYTFNFLIGQPLASTPALTFTFTPDFTIASSPTCTVAILTLTVSSPFCTYNNVTNVLLVNFTASALIPINANITVTVSSGITNPSTPNGYPIGLETYYIGTDLTSKVQSNGTAFTAPISEISNYSVALTPTDLTVYTSTPIVLSFVPIVNIPTSSSFSIQFPAGVSLISANNNLLRNGGTPLPLSTGPLYPNSTTVTFVSGVQISAGSNISITITLTTPSNMGTYSFVRLIVSNSGTAYLSNRASLFLNVNSVNSMTVFITPNTATAGATSSYTFTMMLTVPHGNSFIVQVDVPSDTTYLTSGSTCTNCSTSTLSPAASSFSFVATNAGGPAASSYSFTVNSFTNPRAVGSSRLWGIATKTVSPTNLISHSYARAHIVNPNTLTRAELSNNESYFRNNSSPVKMTLGFFNRLVDGDYIMVTFTSSSYTASNVLCSPIYGSCGILGTPTLVTVVKITPNTTSILNNTLFLILEGLTSSPTTQYGVTSPISVSTFNSSGQPMDSGSISYNISCGAVPSSQCRQCYLNNSCINCYPGYFLQGSICVSACGVATSYLSYANSTTGTCVTCINNCYQCYSATHCKSCLPSNVLFLTDGTCRSTCPTTNGFYLLDGQCGQCLSNCLQCKNSSNSCTRCNSGTFLINGQCKGSCGSTNFYQLNGQCLPCDQSCYNCSGAGSGSCYLCNANYHRYLTLCVDDCPAGTAVNPTTGDCGCDSECLTCSTYTACTACLNSSEWALNGGCVDSCPQSTYPNAGQCIACSAGCLDCSINTCTACVNSSYLFNNSCYSDCNLISQQYDVFGASCVLCPTGCDHCEGTNCTACLDAFTLNSSQCIRTCLLSNTCDLTQRVLPLPGVLSLAVWVAISVVIHLLYHKNYLPYSIVLLSGVVQFVLILALISSVNVPSSRLLATDTAYLGQMRGLLAGAIAANYLLNIAYLVIFICYIKPLITNARQIDIISNVVVLIIAVLTNFRFGLVAFARMFPKPNIYVKDASKLTPVHYLCLISLVLDLLSVVACGLGLIYSRKMSNTFMLSLDLMIVIAVNMAMTIWFVAVRKPDEYFEDTVKKYHIEEGHTRTNETLPNEKNFSKANMVGNQSFNFDDFDRTENDEASYNKLTHNKAINSNGQIIVDDDIIKENPLPITVLSKSKKKADPSDDPNFEANLKSKRSTLKDSKMKISKASLGNSIDKEGKSVDENISPRRNHVVTSNFNKDAVKSERKVQPQKNIVEVEENDYPQLEQNSFKEPSKVFNQRQTKPKKVNQQKAKGNEQPKTKAQSRAKPKGVQEPMKLMKKGDKKIGYFQSDAYESNGDGDDIEQIIKQKIWQSTIKVQKPSLSSGVESETGHEQISPSWFNIQNQRLDITDLEEADPE